MQDLKSLIQRNHVFHVTYKYSSLTRKAVRNVLRVENGRTRRYSRVKSGVSRKMTYCCVISKLGEQKQNPPYIYFDVAGICARVSTKLSTKSIAM